MSRLVPAVQIVADHPFDPGDPMPERLTIEETDEWYEVVDEADCVVAQFTDFDDARWFVNYKEEADDDANAAPPSTEETGQ